MISLHCIAADVGRPVERFLGGEALLLLRRGHAPHLEEIVKLGEIDDSGKLPVLRQRLQPLQFRTAPLDVAEPLFLRIEQGFLGREKGGGRLAIGKQRYRHVDAVQDERPKFKRHLARRDIFRSEEHTSELQSLMRISYAVFCLQKKKK